ncbi:c-type cytochrome [Meiothermus sp. CFH 77666]|uniref:c-type cytochrome n=1 Tax=Meiothermus sp. CFH 77666 TaxID=2817942 RepID=UPI001AA0A83D|nr:c-type cytochrome [Meiothermus sp. CFH 77666]MBO1436397.1 c-type cytochrome [Meiothermus sp. CFH 77666]
MKQLLVVMAALLGLAIAADGGQLYSQNCAGCHGASGQGIPGVFPPLAGNPRVQDEAYVVKAIRQGISGPLEVNGQAYNGAMPAMPQISEADARAIAAYTRELGRAPTATPASPEPATTPADPALAARGKALFLGQTRFQNGGAPCMACHTAGNFGPMGGGSLGRDLTDLHTRLGAAGIQGVLSNIAFPVMRESYQGKPLTPEEISALTAFFARTAGQPANTNQMDMARMLFAGLIGFGGLFGGMYLFWSNRRVGLAERIRNRRSA